MKPRKRAAAGKSSEISARCAAGAFSTRVWAGWPRGTGWACARGHAASQRAQQRAQQRALSVPLRPCRHTNTAAALHGTSSAGGTNARGRPPPPAPSSSSARRARRAPRPPPSRSPPTTQPVWSRAAPAARPSASCPGSALHRLDWPGCAARAERARMVEGCDRHRRGLACGVLRTACRGGRAGAGPSAHCTGRRVTGALSRLGGVSRQQRE